MKPTYNKCLEKDCKNKVEKPYLYCSIECACYDGCYSVTKGWIKHPITREEL